MYYYYPYLWGNTWYQVAQYTLGDNNYIYGDLDPTYEDEIRIVTGRCAMAMCGASTSCTTSQDAVNFNVGLGVPGGPTSIPWDVPGSWWTSPIRMA